MTSLGDFFPNRAIHLKNQSFSWRNFMFLILIVPVFAILAIYDFKGAVSSFSDEIYLKDSGILARSAHLASGAKCTRWDFILVDCEFAVIYITAEGAALKKDMRITSLFKSIDTALPLEVRYDPADPERIGTNWGANLLIHRIPGRILVLAFYIGGVIGGIAGIMLMPGRVKDVRAAGRNPTPIAVQFTRAVTIRNRLHVYYRWRDPRTGLQRNGAANLGEDLEPFWLNTEKKIMLALLSPKGKAYLLDADLALTDLTAAEKINVNRLSKLF